MKSTLTVIRQGNKQKLVQTWYLFGIAVWSKVLDVELIPVWHDASVKFLGSSVWRSKFSAHIR